MKRLALALAATLAATAAWAQANKPEAEPDVVYGAFQRGYYRTAFSEATKRVEEKNDVKSMTLLGELYAGEHLSDRPDDPRPSDRHEIRAATRGTKLGEDTVDDGGTLATVIGRGLVDRRTEQLIEPDARIGRVDRRPGQDEVDGKARLRAGRRGQPRMVRPAAAGGHQRVGSLG